MAALIKDVISIFKLRIGVAIMLSAVAGMAIVPGPSPEVWRAALLALAVLLASASAGAFNQWAEADLDRKMVRTADRPFAAGRFRADALWLAAIAGLLVVAVVLAAMVANAEAAFHTFMGAFVYGVVYTLWLKRRSVANIVVGGLAGSFAVLAGAAAVEPGLGVEALILATVLFLWTPPHFWSLAIAERDAYAGASVPMLPVVVGNELTAKIILAHTAALATLSLIPAAMSMGPLYLLGAGSGGVLFVWTSWRLVRETNQRRAMQNFFASLVQLMLLLAGTIADRALGPL